MIRFHERISSTQDEMKRLTAAGEVSHLDAVMAANQTGGRGRADRQWLSPRGNLSVSVFLSEFRMPLTWIPLWIGYSTHQALLRFSGINKETAASALRLKWPNDLVLSSGEKLGGILCEKVESGVVAGIGLNLESAPVLPDRKSASLKDFLKALGVARPLPPREILDAILVELKKEPDTTELRSAYFGISLFAAGDRIRWRDVRTGGAGNNGRLIGLGDHGELRVELADGSIQALFSEEIEGVRQDPISNEQ
jgi:BirA family biotin operon repressor/biotin-[acetyl-CoA-carboxylase] ligase